MNTKGLIDDCRMSGCGWKCCTFGSNGHIVLLPGELEQTLNSSHLKIIDRNYFGGCKARCVAKDCKTCDNGYKPIMCRVYPLWVKSVSKGIVFKSNKCPLTSNQLQDHSKYVLNIFERYNEDVKVDEFLSKAWIDNYELLDIRSFNTGLNLSKGYQVRALSITDLASVMELEKTQDEPRLCCRSEYKDILKSVTSGCSYGLYYKNSLVAYSLCYVTDYGTAYIDKCFVHSKHRGHSYQRLLLQHNIKSLLSNGVCEIYAMTSPNNIASLKSFTSVGFSVMRDAKFSGYERYILKWSL